MKNSMKKYRLYDSCMRTYGISVNIISFQVFCDNNSNSSFGKRSGRKVRHFYTKMEKFPFSFPIRFPSNVFNLTQEKISPQFNGVERTIFSILANMVRSGETKKKIIYSKYFFTYTHIDLLVNSFSGEQKDLCTSFQHLF